jgi:4-amino-4-deoxy-L-arabinose transferase-like glycosyltransferase
LDDSLKINRTLLVWAAFFVVTAEAVFSVPLLGWELAMGAASHWGGWIALAALVVVASIVWRWKNQLRALLEDLSNLLRNLPVSQFQWSCFAVGAVLRILWFLLYPAPQHSDQAAYFGLARSLVENHTYGISNGGLAYWPPGYPFFLAGWLLVFGFKFWVPLLANVALFGASLFVVGRLARRIGGTAAGHLSVLFLVFWPTMVMTAGLASKELLVLFLLCLALLIFTDAREAVSLGKGIALATLTGLLLGFASLTQPSLMLFPTVLVACEWLFAEKLSRSLSRVAVVAAALCIAILPWTFRNHRVLGAWVPISTNGGDVFYRANNPLATGGYTPAGEQSLEGLGEVQRGKVGFRLGKEWIRAHPGRFLALAVRKQVLFLGDDAQGAFETLKRGLGIGGIRYFAWKGISNLYWWFLWILVFILLVIHWDRELSRNPLLATVMVGILYLYSIHSVFESGAKYHEPLMGLFAVLAGQVFARADESRSENRSNPRSADFPNHSHR